MKILVYPKDRNPYQELLYKAVRPLGAEIKYITPAFGSHTLGLVLLIPTLLYYRLQGYSIFHLHWIYTFQFPSRSPLFYNAFTRFFFTLYFYIVIFAIKLFQYKLVWTVHNILPHHTQFSNDKQAMRFLSRQTNATIVHSHKTIEEMKELGLSTKPTVIIPIGNYIDVYPNTVSKKEARNILQIDEKELVLLFFGRLERYKGLLELLSLYRQRKIHAKLIIAGPCHDPVLLSQINTYKSNSQIIMNVAFIPDKELQTYINAADLVICPFLKITTSSTVVVAAGFSKPIIAPRLGVLKELPEDIGFFYDPEDTNGLLNAIKKATSHYSDLEKMGKSARRYAESLSWGAIAEKTYTLYQSID